MTSTFDSNKTTYEDEDVVRFYSKHRGLFKPERSILQMIRPRLSEMRMLDIGVGGGRTTEYFAPIAKEYVGVDYSRGMIDYCRERFRSMSGKASFRVCDARSMLIFEDHSFDFVLFSFNGIDYMNHDDRLIVQREVARLLRKGGYFGFSAHNLLYMSTLLAFPHTLYAFHPLQLRRFLLLRLLNTRPNLSSATHSIIRDGAHDFRLVTYYVLPSEQIAQLKSCGFSSILLLGLDGFPMSSTGTSAQKDWWVYYFCQV